MNKLKYLIALSFLLPFFGIGQGENKVKKAANKFNEHAYVNAIVSYEDLVENGYSEEEAFKNLGDANYYNANYEAATEWYGKLLEMEIISNKAEYIYRYAQTLKSIEKYEESNQWMRKLMDMENEDGRAQKFASNIDYLEKIQRNSGRYVIKNASFNSEVSDFAPSFYGDAVVFSSARDTSKVIDRLHSWNNKPFLNLYQTDTVQDNAHATVTKLTKTLNKKTHESSTAFTKDGNTLYFTRNNSNDGRFERDKQGVSRLKLYRATLIDGDWSNVEELPFNSDDYSVAHPTLSSDEKKLYFASDMPGTLGQSDIFVLTINDDGSFGEPVNLGNKINTEGRETFPFVTEKDVLYFASDGHPGLGGLDIFATKVGNGDYQYVVNVGKPVNSIMDDFSFIMNDTTKKGFFASNRKGGMGSDDIYGFIETKEIDLDCNTQIEGTVKDQETLLALGNAIITMYDDNDDEISSTTSATDGSFSLKGNCQQGSYKLIAQKDEFDNATSLLTLHELEDNKDVEMVLEKTIKRAKVGTDLIQFLNLSPVYFDLDKSDIRDDAEKTLEKIVEYLKAFSDIKIEVRSHTDAKASKTYNDRLSDRRAKATVEYLIEKGVDKTKITGNGYGESQLINDCTTREKCEDEQHQLNRRSEFVVTE